MEKCYKRCHQYKSCQECLGSSGGAEAGKYIQIDFQKCFRAQSRKSNRKAWFRYPASLVRRFWEM